MQTLTILANIDAPFYPIRSSDPSVRMAVHQARRAYFANGGTRWHAGGSGADRVAAMRELDHLELTGQVKVIRRPGRAVHVRLTGGTDAELRRRCCAKDFAAAKPLLGLLASTEQHHGVRYLRQTWTAETHLAGCDYGEKKVSKLLSAWEEQMLPLIVRGCVESNSDLQGRVYYRLTPAGRHESKRVDLEAEPVFYDPNPDDRREYLDLVRTERNRITSQPAADAREIGPIPIPASL